MGGKQSKLDPAYKKQLSVEYDMDERMVERSEMLFREADRSSSGALTHDDFIAWEYMRVNPFRERFFEVFAGKEPGATLKFEQFLALISVMQLDGRMHDKTVLLFQLYDLDEDGEISYKDLYNVMSLLLGSHVGDTSGLRATDVSVFIEKVLDECGVTEMRSLSQRDFQSIMDRCPDLHAYVRFVCALARLRSRIGS